MSRMLRLHVVAWWFVAMVATAPTVCVAAEESLEFFESKVRPLLAEHCYSCHSADAKIIKGGLRLDSRDALLTGGDSGEVIVPGKPDESGLIHAVRWESFEMPPNGKLREDEIAVLVDWVKRGAPWPQESTSPAPKQTTRKYDWAQLRESHWAWKPVERPQPPQVRDRAWPQGDIDQFVLAKLEAAGLKPSQPAEPRVLVRRIYFDLLGLPPSPEQVGAFVKRSRANSQAAVEDLVEELLASPHYGERWGRYWLDVARYSDGYGGFLDNKNEGLPNAWRYRDWVVDALNRDMPYNEFVRLQLAGDLVSKEHAVATGFLTLGPTYIGDGGDPEALAQAKAETLDDRVDTVTRGLMAMTVSCARCHDHRFDPYPQLDYYSLAGVFNNTKAVETPLVPPEVVKAYKEHIDTVARLEKESQKVRSATRTENRDLTDDENRRVEEIKNELKQLNDNAPKKYPFIHAVTDAGSADMPLAIRGNLLKPGEIAPRRFLRIVAGENPPRFMHGSGRIDLADAIVDPTNPLTSRVIVNRVWQHHFGQAFVITTSNFGMLGEKPSHPELLDWLASKFVGSEDGDFRWSLKRLHRAIVTSATYQQASDADEHAQTIDGDNKLLWRMNPRRLDVEAWRDAVLMSTGELDEKLGGASIDDITKSTRRTLYAAVSRNGDRFANDTFLRLFDFPAPRATSEGRTSSVVPQQSLFLMNSRFMSERAKKLAERLEKAEKKPDRRIKLAYMLLYSRAVTPEEASLGKQFLKHATTDGQLTPWQQYAQVLLSATELMYLK